VEEEIGEGRRQAIRVLAHKAWKTFIEHWSSEQVMAQAEKMKKTLEAVKNPSHVGRAGSQRA
jgi:thiaminase